MGNKGQRKAIQLTQVSRELVKGAGAKASIWVHVNFYAHGPRHRGSDLLEGPALRSDWCFPGAATLWALTDTGHRGHRLSSPSARQLMVFVLLSEAQKAFLCTYSSIPGGRP